MHFAGMRYIGLLLVGRVLGDVMLTGGINGFYFQATVWGEHHVPMLVDTSSQYSFIYANVAGDLPKRNLVSPVRFRYDGGHLVEAWDVVHGLMNGLGDKWEDAYLVAAHYQVPGVNGALSLGPTSRVGKKAFAFIPESGGKIRLTTDINKVSERCSEEMTTLRMRREPLDRDHLLVVRGRIGIGELVVRSPLLIATGKRGLELPASVYATFINELNMYEGVDIRAPANPWVDDLIGPAILCETQYVEQLPKISVTLGHKEKKISIELGFGDFAEYHEDTKQCHIAVTRAKETQKNVAIGSLVMGRFVTVIDAPNAKIAICHPRMV